MIFLSYSNRAEINIDRLRRHKFRLKNMFSCLLSEVCSVSISNQIINENDSSDVIISDYQNEGYETKTPILKWDQTADFENGTKSPTLKWDKTADL